MTRPSPPTALWPNFGAEENKDTDRGHQPPRSSAVLQRVARLWALLFAPGARLLPAGDPVPWPAGLGPPPADAAFDWLPTQGEGVPWLSTRSARKELEALGHRYHSSAPEVARAASDKGFAQAVAFAGHLDSPLLHGHVHTLSPSDLRDPDVRAHIARWIAATPPGLVANHTLKPRWGLSGRGRVQVDAEEANALTPDTLERLAVRGGALLEPWLDRIEDFSAQMRVHPDGGVTLLGTSRQLLTRAGVYLGNRAIGIERPEAGTTYDHDVAGAGLRAAEAAARLGFVGPCGTDAFSFRGPDGEPLLRPLVELNARFTLGTIAFGLARRALAAGIAERSDRWCFLLAARRDAPTGRDVTRIHLDDGPQPPTLALARDDAPLDAFLAGSHA